MSGCLISPACLVLLHASQITRLFSPFLLSARVERVTVGGSREVTAQRGDRVDPRQRQCLERAGVERERFYSVPVGTR